MTTGTSSAAAAPSADLKRRRRFVEERLREAGRPRLARRSPPPEGRLGADEQPMRRLREALVELGPVFAGFGRYLSSRIDLLPRRDCLELAAIGDGGEPLPPSAVSAIITQELGAPPDRRFFAFDESPHRIRRWTQQHGAWLSPGVPVTVTIVRPDATAALASDALVLPLLAPWLGITDAALAFAVEDFSSSVRQRLDQVQQANALGKLAADVRAGGLFDAPGAYRSHCSESILTLERVDGIPADQSFDKAADADAVASAEAARVQFAGRIASAWLRQATVGQVVPFDFDASNLWIVGARLVLTGGSFEPHSAAHRARFLNYVNAVAVDDPDTAAAWLLADTTDSPIEEEVRRRLRQAVPFRDGEWSGEDRLAEQLLVQWRVTRQAGLELQGHQLHVYRGIQAVSVMTAALAPATDVLLAALQDERLRVGFGTAQPLIDPRALPATLDKLLQDMVNLPQKLDEVLTLAADGRLRVKLHVPHDEHARRTRNRTVSLVSGLVVLTAVAFALRHAAVSQVPGLEQIGALFVMVIGIWLLVAAARL
jgi:predicted unusual protein kinase regulating ubiquinone biosynthesis (AarF/ABC1/UbiB family)